MEPRGIQSFPPEVFHIILGYLGGNKPTLRSCSLVCRTWLQASRPRLFATVSLHSRERRLFEFMEFLDSHPDIAGHVRSFILKHSMDDPEFSDGLASSVTPSTFARTARKLPRLRECQLYFVHIVPTVDLTQPPPESTDVPGAPPIPLTVFHVFGSNHQETGPFLELLTHFRIDRLELELVSFIKGPFWGRPAPPPIMGKIEVHDLWANLETANDAPLIILSELGPALVPGALHAFHCRWTDQSECAIVGAFLRTVGTSITDLALNMSVVPWVEDAGRALRREDWVDLNLDACLNIRRFQMDIPLPSVMPPSAVVSARHYMASYRSLLSQLPRTVHTVVLYMSTISQRLLPPHRLRVTVPNLIPVDFAEIEEALLGLPELEKVVIATRAGQSGRLDAATVAKSFPRLGERGVLEITPGMRCCRVSGPGGAMFRRY